MGLGTGVERPLVVCGLLARWSFEFIKVEREYSSTLLTQLPQSLLTRFGGDGVPAWMVQSIIPVAFALITWRYLVFLAVDVVGLVRADPHDAAPVTIPSE